LRRIWFRATLYSAASIVVALIAAALGPYIPDTIEQRFDSETVENILNILASSMLAVTTFSLSIMVSAYASAASNSTPRATGLLLADSVAANTLATFLGSFLFAVVGIVGLSAEIYGDKGRIILFVSTLVVLFMVTFSLLRWIEQLTRFGRVGDTIARVEAVASRAARNWAALPRLGAAPPEDAPENAFPIYLERAGYVQHIDMEELADTAKKAGLIAYLRRAPGHFVSPNIPVAHLSATPDDDTRRDIQSAFTIQPDRTFEQDPRFGLIVLSEIASRALSPAVNDPGTAIQVLGAGVRTFLAWCDGHADLREPRFPNVHAPDIPAGEMLEDFFIPIARDGAGILEVQMRLQANLHTIALANREHFGEAAKRQAAMALKRALAELDTPLEQSRLRRRADWHLPDKVTGEEAEKNRS
ncbi:MAG: DUF2254 domain-containing protein, partial [Pseudomonadota bacterium]